MSDSKSAGHHLQCEHEWIGWTWIDTNGEGGHQLKCCKCGAGNNGNKPVKLEDGIIVSIEVVEIPSMLLE